MINRKCLLNYVGEEVFDIYENILPPGDHSYKDLLTEAKSIELTREQVKELEKEVEQEKVDAVRRQQQRLGKNFSERKNSSKCFRCDGEFPHKGRHLVKYVLSVGKQDTIRVVVNPRSHIQGAKEGCMRELIRTHNIQDIATIE